jgi:sugar phosphate isomerase/epimerase
MNKDAKLSFQLYSLRHYGDIARQLDLLHSAGFRYVETIMSNYDSVDHTRRLLEEREISAPTGHFSMTALRQRLDWTIAVAKSFRMTQIGMPDDAENADVLPAEGWQRIGRELGEIGNRLSDCGIRLAYHNHDVELRRLPDGLTALDHIFLGAGDRPLYWQIDVAWLRRGGGDPLLWLEHFPGRIISCHVKDLAPIGQNLSEGGWAGTGYGVIGWDSLWAKCIAAGAEWMIVEHDDPSQPEDFVRSSFAYAARMLSPASTVRAAQE